MKRIFISYKRDDKKLVLPIKRRIEDATGEKCWIDIDGIESDAQFVNVISKAINDADIFLFMYSKRHSQIENVEEDWTLREISLAQKKKKRIVLVMLDGTPLTDDFELLFGLKQHVDATSNEAMNLLIQDINKWSGNNSTPITPTKRNTKFKWIFVGIAVVSVILIICFIPHFITQKGNSAQQIYISKELMCVDLGLPSGTLWADRNVGAQNGYESGNHYKWKEIQLNENWLLPTEEQYEELKSLCTWEWETENMQTGYSITGPNGGSIFLPAAGCVLEKTGYKYGNQFGYYWIGGRPMSSEAYAKELIIGRNEINIETGRKTIGRSIRPVIVMPPK